MNTLPSERKYRVHPRCTGKRPGRRGRTLQTGFTLVETMVAIGITAMAGAAVLLGIQSSLQTTTHVVEKTVANGLAHQLMDEITGCRYVEYGADPYQTALAPESAELVYGIRVFFDDIDDFHAQDNRPAVDAWDVVLGHDDGLGGTRNEYFTAPRALLDRLRRTVDVYYVNPSDLSQGLSIGQSSDYRAVEVSVSYCEDNGDQRELVKLRRIVVNLSQ
ncbi:MAG: type II secretion system protein [Planctomycetota bacterium]|nr:type II secretion system protein [Planctomycetota bacterium]